MRGRGGRIKNRLIQARDEEKPRVDPMKRGRGRVSEEERRGESEDGGG